MRPRGRSAARCSLAADGATSSRSRRLALAAPALHSTCDHCYGTSAGAGEPST